jgi:hypothetical protein
LICGRPSVWKEWCTLLSQLTIRPHSRPQNYAPVLQEFEIRQFKLVLVQLEKIAKSVTDGALSVAVGIVPVVVGFSTVLDGTVPLTVVCVPVAEGVVPLSAG